MRRDILMIVCGMLIGIFIQLPHYSQPNVTSVHVRERMDTARVLHTEPSVSVKLAAQSKTKKLSEHRSLHQVDTLLIDSSTGRVDTITIQHMMPEDSFYVSIAVGERKDTVTVPYVARDSIYVHTEVKEDNWLMQLLKQLLTFLVGVLVGKTL